VTPRRRLSPPRTVAGRRIAVLEEWTVAAWSTDGRLGGHGSKRPRAILIGEAEGVRCFAPDGAPMTPARIDALLPGAMAEFWKGATRDTLTPEDEEEDPR
jgi:hypothetical protein